MSKKDNNKSLTELTSEKSKMVWKIKLFEMLEVPLGIPCRGRVLGPSGHPPRDAPAPDTPDTADAPVPDAIIRTVYGTVIRTNHGTVVRMDDGTVIYTDHCSVSTKRNCYGR